MEIIQQILAIGGFGYLNYYLFFRITDVSEAKDETKYQILFFASLDYAIYLLSGQLVKGVFYQALLTVIIALVVTLAMPKVVNLIYKAINKRRESNGLIGLDLASVYDKFSRDRDRYWFVFGLSNDYLISKGYPIDVNGDNEDLSFGLQSLLYSEGEVLFSIANYQDLEKYLVSNGIDYKTYINVEKGLRIVSFC